EMINLPNRSVENDNGKIVVGNVQYQVLAHHGQTNKTEVTTGNDPHRPADIDAGQTCAIVSPLVSSTLFSKADTRKIRLKRL
ncbi:MAG: hypothetical protein Q9214_004535, partial [Letrouitia sp. 1 TL-2023]